MEIITVYYKKLSKAEGFILSIRCNRRTMTELAIPVVGVIGMILKSRF